MSKIHALVEAAVHSLFSTMFVSSHPIRDRLDCMGMQSNCFWSSKYFQETDRLHMYKTIDMRT